MSTSDGAFNAELAERLLVVDNLKKSVQVIKDTNRKEESLLKLWKFLFETMSVVLVILAIKIISFISFWKAHYREFIAFIEKYRTMTDENGRQIYTGPSGLMTALSLESNILQLTFANKFLPEALFILYSTPTMYEIVQKEGGEKILQNVYMLSIEGTPSSGKLNAPQLACQGIKMQFPDFDDSTCGSVCGVKAANASMPLGQRLIDGITQNSTTVGMIGHIAMGPLGAGAGLLVGAGIGALSAYLQDRDAKDICSRGRKYCQSKTC